MTKTEQINWEAELAADMAAMTHDPLKHAVYSYPWGVEGTPLADHKGPREWQRKVLSRIGEHLQNPDTRHQPIQVAISSGHGIGKSALIGMIIKWAMDTCEDTKVVVTANTDTQLRTKTAPEVIKWAKMSQTSHWFEYPATSIYSNLQGHDKSWRCDFIPWSDTNPEAFAGLHNEGKRIVVVMDEGSSIADKIWEVVEGTLTDENTEIIWVVCGNPTRANGRFRECFRKHSKLWTTFKVDSRTVEGTNKAQIQRWQDTYGEDSDFFRVRVRGEFPSASAYQFIPASLLDRARAIKLRRDQYDFAPKILTCDPAWTGDDSLVIAMRQGLHFEILDKIPKNDNDVLVATKLMQYEDKYQADAVFIDGAYGTGIISVAKTNNRHGWQLVWFNQQSGRKDCVNKRAEMIVMVKEWLESGGSIPETDDELYEEACAIELVESLDGKFKFIPKDDIRELIGRSPGCFDSLMLSFAIPVAKRAPIKRLQDRFGSSADYAGDYDPLKNV